jgi:hypothetical protein
MIDATQLERIGVFVDRDGQYKRYRTRIENTERDPAPEARTTGRLISYDLVKVPHPVVLPLATDPESIEDARQKAVRSQADFYHPRHGWLRWGRKREADAPENMGSGSVSYASERVQVEPASPPSTLRPAPQPTPPTVPEPDDPDTDPETEPVRDRPAKGHRP